MKQFLKTPFLFLLLVTMLISLPFVWKEMGILPLAAEDTLSPEESETPDAPELSQPEEPVPPSLPEPQAPVTVPEAPKEPEASDTPNIPAVSPSAGDPWELPVAPDPSQEPKEPVKPEEPFVNALFIGDSRTVGLAEYSGIPDADFYAYTGMSVYTAFKKESSVGGWEKGTLLEDVLTGRQYDRVYLMLGINELGYNFNSTVEKYGEVVSKIRELQPDAYLILEASLHVTSARSDSDKTFNNSNIDRMNLAQAAYADNQHIFYIDVNPVFDDENGALAKEYTGDNTHPYGKYCAKWAEWLMENTPA